MVTLNYKKKKVKGNWAKNKRTGQITYTILKKEAPPTLIKKIKGLWK